MQVHTRESVGYELFSIIYAEFMHDPVSCFRRGNGQKSKMRTERKRRGAGQPCELRCRR